MIVLPVAPAVAVSAQMVGGTHGASNGFSSGGIRARNEGWPALFFDNGVDFVIRQELLEWIVHGKTS